MKIIDRGIPYANVAYNTTNHPRSSRPIFWMEHTTCASHWAAWVRVYKNTRTGKINVYFGTCYETHIDP